MQAFGPWGVFALAIIDSIGVPLPAAIDGLLITMAATGSHSPHVAYFTALLAVVGSVMGNAVLFLAARQGNRMFSKSEPPPGKRQRFLEFFQRYGLLTIFFPAVVPFVPLPLKVFVISAGAFRTPFGKFLAAITLARVIRYFALAYLGLQLGARCERLSHAQRLGHYRHLARDFVPAGVADAPPRPPLRSSQLTRRTPGRDSRRPPARHRSPAVP